MSVVSTTAGQPPAAAPMPLGESAHDKAMIEAVDKASGAAPAAAPAPSGAQRPEGVPEKFWDAEKGVVKTDDLLKSYSELEKARSGAAPAPKAPDAPPADDAAAKAAEEAAKAAGADTSKVDFAVLSANYAKNGALSAEEYTALEKAGLSKDLVDAHIAGLEAQSQLLTQEAHAQVGGKETFESMLKWAASNLSPGEREAFDTAVVGSKESRAMAISSLKSKFDAAVGSDPTLVRGGGQASAGAYQSRAEVTRDMADPRYAKDPAFRAEVERKLMNSSVF